DLISATEAVEVIHVKRAEINLHGLKKVLQRHALRLGFEPIDVRVELRHVDREGGEQSRKAGGLIAFAQQRLHALIESVVTEVRAVFDVELETADGAKSHHWRRRHCQDKGLLNPRELLVERAGNGRAREVRRLALGKGFQAEEDDASVWSDAESTDAQPGKGHRVLHARL